MQPTLTLLGHSVDTYAVFTALAYVLGLGLAVLLGRRDGRRPDDLALGSVVLVLSCLLGGKLFHTLFEARGHPLRDGRVASGTWDLLRDDPWHWARIFEPGFVFYGGLVVATGTMIVFARRRGLDRIGAGFDCAAPGLALGMVIGRVGCFLAGCCHGSETALSWGVQYPAPHPMAGVPVHPVQLYESGFHLLALLLMPLLFKRRIFEGHVFVFLVGSYAVARAGLEMLRGDVARGLWLDGALSTSQGVSLVIGILAVAVRLHFPRRRGDRRAHHAPQPSSSSARIPNPA
ncbi:MAG: prolipoprotein diacylglyceryl transferase family protein [Myxococcota bacterium]